MPPKAKQEEELSDEEFEEQALEVVATTEGAGKLIAQKVFGVETPSDEMIYGCHDRVFCYDDEKTQDIVVDELMQAHKLAGGREGAGPQSATKVFWIYDNLFDDEDED